MPIQQEVRGSGGRGQKRLRNLHHQVNESSLLKIENHNNSYCFFYALEITRIHNTKMMRQQNFSYYFAHRQLQKQDDIMRLMNNVEIPIGQPDYDASIYIPKIVNYWNTAYETSI